MVVIKGSCVDSQVEPPALIKQSLTKQHRDRRACVCERFCMHGCVFSVCLCVRTPAWENLIYSPQGHLLTESNPLTGPGPNGSLTRLLLYIAAVMGTSLEILALLICAPLPRFEQKTPRIQHTASLHRETPDALRLQRINQSTFSQHSRVSTCCRPGRRFLRGAALSVSPSMLVHLQLQLEESLPEKRRLSLCCPCCTYIHRLNPIVQQIVALQRDASHVSLRQRS